MALRDTARVLVASQFAQVLDFFDADTFERTGRIENILAQPHEMAFDPARRLVYITITYRAGAYDEGKPKGHEIVVVDVDEQQVVDTIDITPYVAPHDIDFDADSDLIYISVEADEGRNGIVVIDPTSRKVIDSIPVKARNSHWMTVTPNGKRAFIAHKEAEVISVLDLESRKQIAEVPSPGGAEELDSSPDGRWVFANTPMMSLTINVSQGQLNKKPTPPGVPTPRVLKIDVASNETVGQVDFDEFLSAVRIAPDGRVLVTEMRFPEPGEPAAGPVNGRIHVIDPESLEVLASIGGDELPFTTRINDDSSRAFVANLKTGSVTVIDLSTYDVVATLDNNITPGGFGGTHGMCFIPAAAGN